jgi:hypothetical protein
MSVEKQVGMQSEEGILFRAFDRVFTPNLYVYESVGDLLSEQRELVDGMCRILARLGLVLPDHASPFGFKPTLLLEDIVRRRGLRPRKRSKKEVPSIEDQDVLDSIFDAALTFDERFLVCDWAADLLHVLGLVVRCRGDYTHVPTLELRVLAAAQRDKERNQLLHAACEAGEWPPRQYRVSA